MVRGVAVNHVYGVKTYGGSSPSHRANLLVGTRVVAGGGLLILWRKPVAGSNPALSAKSRSVAQSGQRVRSGSEKS